VIIVIFSLPYINVTEPHISYSAPAPGKIAKAKKNFPSNFLWTLETLNSCSCELNKWKSILNLVINAEQYESELEPHPHCIAAPTAIPQILWIFNV
jgi:hypothetical protein